MYVAIIQSVCVIFLLTNHVAPRTRYRPTHRYEKFHRQRTGRMGHFQGVSSAYTRAVYPFRQTTSFAWTEAG
jgi:hypothetical protein